MMFPLGVLSRYVVSFSAIVSSMPVCFGSVAYVYRMSPWEFIVLGAAQYSVASQSSRELVAVISCTLQPKAGGRQSPT